MEGNNVSNLATLHLWGLHTPLDRDITIDLGPNPLIKYFRAIQSMQKDRVGRHFPSRQFEMQRYSNEMICPPPPSPARRALSYHREISMTAPLPFDFRGAGRDTRVPSKVDFTTFGTEGVTCARLSKQRSKIQNERRDGSIRDK